MYWLLNLEHGLVNLSSLVVHAHNLVADMQEYGSKNELLKETLLLERYSVYNFA